MNVKFKFKKKFEGKFAISIISYDIFGYLFNDLPGNS